MKTNRNEVIAKYLIEYPEVGEEVNVEDTIGEKRVDVKVKTINDENGDITADITYRRDVLIKRGRYKRSTIHIGYNPIVDKPWNSALRTISFGLQSIVYACGYERREGRGVFKTETFGDVEIPELNWNPFLVDENGNEVNYQRGFVWSLNDKQLLIESIYNNIDIGKIVIRKRSYDWVEARVKQGKVAGFKDIVDGKQRLSTILDFISDKFTDKEGFYFSDFSERAKRRFFNFSALSYGELGENTSDEDTKKVFLGVNFAGVPMSQEQIDFVKTIKI